jgi:hypothetical protein
MTAKRWLSVLFALAALLILASCGGGGESQGTAIATTATTSPSQPTTAPVKEVQTLTPSPETEKSQPPEIETFQQEGEGANGLSVVVTLPWQGQPMKIEKLPFGPPSNPKDEPPFQLIRPFINFEVIDVDGKVVTTFNAESPLVIEAQYSSDDLAKADGNMLVLGFEKNGVWKQFDNTVIDDKARTGTVKVTEWGDRHIGWGSVPLKQ